MRVRVILIIILIYSHSIWFAIRTNYRLIVSQPIYTQRLLVLLFGTFRVIASNSERAGTGMSSEAIGVSVAPSFFQSCVSDGKTARMEDVLRYKVSNNAMMIIEYILHWILYETNHGTYSPSFAGGYQNYETNDWSIRFVRFIWSWQLWVLCTSYWSCASSARWMDL